MKKHFYLIIAILTCFMSCFLNNNVVNAATAQEVKERWYTTRYYPLYQGNSEWQKHNMEDTLDILNPPLDLLLSMSTEELAMLVQEYPCLDQMMTYYNPDGTQDYQTYFSFIESYSDIFYELLRRDDGITCLLQEYRTHELDVQKLNEGDGSTHDMWLIETFGCQFIRYYSHHFTDDEFKLASQIIEEKKKLYSLLDDRLLYYFDLPEIEPPTGEKESTIRTNYLKPEEIENKEGKLSAALLQLQLKEDHLQTENPDAEESSLPSVTPYINDSNSAKQETNNESIAEADNKTHANIDDSTTTDLVTTTVSKGNDSLLITLIIVGVLVVLACIVGGFVLIRKRRKIKG